MAAPAQSPLRRWKRFFGAFASVDAAIEAAEPVLGSRREFQSARVYIVERLCGVADDDHAEAERLCLLLDDMIAESLETLRLIPATPPVLATTDLAKSVGALQKHDSERVRLLARGIVTGWRASVQDVLDKAREAMKRLDNLPQPKEEIGGQQQVHADARRTKQPVKKILEMSDKLDTISQLKKIDQRLTDARATRPAKIPETSVKKPSDPSLCYEEKMEVSKRKFNEGYREADDAKRQRKIQVVEAPEMLKQRSRARCGGSSIVNKTFSAIHRA